MSAMRAAAKAHRRAAGQAAGCNVHQESQHSFYQSDWSRAAWESRVAGPACILLVVLPFSLSPGSRGRPKGGGGEGEPVPKTRRIGSCGKVPVLQPAGRERLTCRCATHGPSERTDAHDRGCAPTACGDGWRGAVGAAGEPAPRELRVGAELLPAGCRGGGERVAGGLLEDLRRQGGLRRQVGAPDLALRGDPEDGRGGAPAQVRPAAGAGAGGGRGGGAAAPPPPRAGAPPRPGR